MADAEERRGRSGARRDGPGWAEFLRSRAQGILALDFFTAGLLNSTMTVLREYEDFYNTHWPHRTLNQAAPLPDNATDLDHFRVRRRDRAEA